MRAFQIGKALFILALATGPIVAQENSATLPAELGWVKFRVSAGRLQVASPQYRESRSFESANPLAETSESFRLNVSAQSASILYQQTTPAQTLTVEFDSLVSATIELVPAEPDNEVVAIKYTQKRDGPVRFIIDDGRTAREHKAASFWHLMLTARSDVDKHLLPILAMLRPGWAISETADNIETNMVRLAQSPQRPDRVRWAELVQQLGSPSFQKRRSAERMLRETGPAVVAYLSSLPPHSLDAERQARVSRLLASLSSSTDDTPGRIAMWLIDDPMAWASVLESEQAAHRTVAEAQLENLLNQSINFDPQADKPTRAAQVQSVRNLLQKP